MDFAEDAAVEDGGCGDGEPAVSVEQRESADAAIIDCVCAIHFEAHQRFDFYQAHVIHRVGELKPADQIVLVAVSSAHRGESFKACEFLMDYLKTQAPFWKKEATPEGAKWVDARVSDDEALSRWGIQSRNQG